jgi:hypothetical protein
MKSLRIVALAAFVVLSAAQAQADSIPTGDPVIRTGAGTGSVPITSPKFSILTPTGNSPTDGSDCFLIQGGVSTRAPGCFFSNDITRGGGGVTIYELFFSVSKSDFSGTLSCALSTALGGVSPYFTECAAAPDGRPVVAFFGGPGIPFGDDFSMGFRAFNANTTFGGTAVIPEPGTLVLFVTGIGALLGRRLFAL